VRIEIGIFVDKFLGCGCTTWGHFKISTLTVSYQKKTNSA